ncbi:MAG TPA: 4-hydroxybenzoate octaprenyltransferase [Nitrospirae bacterium]|nr:4-hydroxybenzoate octaprenyltransferase [bacterium BMS3Bbin08]HDH50243.1 4-hydroxybenzoate octaprenyltransferase [Nitrospirota bacterium]HDK17658.1 4-hydroxybenzoate octaprenyltransferase [Nitrospirota bacterium]
MPFLKKTADYLRLIKFSHSIFALPFAFTAALTAAAGIPAGSQIFWITVAMVGGRTGAMGMNRIVDRKIDALNPRTKSRELPRGVMKTWEAAVFTSAAFAVLLFAAYMLNPLCLKVSPLVLLVLFSYSYTKRFTWLSHVVLGTALSLAPLGAWIAIRGTFDFEILPLCFAVMFWVAGFDVLYGLQDIDFDRKHGLYSIPGRFGINKSLWISRSFHIITIGLLLSLIPIFSLSGIYLAGVLIASGLLLYEHRLVKPDDLSKLDMAFFNMNGYISITIFVFTLIDYTIK